jgi:hypothetical protein
MVGPVRSSPLILALLCLAGCEDNSRAEATMFLDRVERLDLDGPMEERRRLVQSLASLPLSSEEVSSARDLCVDAHRAILDAEQSHQRARTHLAEMLEEHGTEAEMPITEKQRIGRDIRDADRALVRSRRLFTDCSRVTEELAQRYRRGGSRRSEGS